jgi:Putative adhesin
MNVATGLMLVTTLIGGPSVNQPPAPAPPPQAAVATAPTSPTDAPQARSTGTSGPRVIPVQRGTRLEVDNFAGEIIVKAGPRDEVVIAAEKGSRAQIEVQSTDKVVSVQASFEGVARSVDFQITVPAWMEVNLTGTYTDISVEGTKAAVTATNVRGDISVKGGADRIIVKSIEGAIVVDGARGRVEANSTSESVTIRDVVGDIVVESVSENIDIERADSTSVEASSVDGDIRFSGPIRDAARYLLTSHDGSITASIPDGSNVTVQARTMGGDFSSNLSVQPTEVRKGRRYRLQIGTGSAQMELESFDGDIRVRRPGTEKAAIKIPAKKDEPRH